MAKTSLKQARRPDGTYIWSRDAVERQLAHAEKNKVIEAYDRAEHLQERREMMQWWADWLEGLK